jgi:hypothetical protein
MLADAAEGAVRSLPEITPTRVEATVHNMAMKRLQDGQFDECDLSLRELSRIEASLAKTLAVHYHGRVAYPKPTFVPKEPAPQESLFATEPQNAKPQDNQTKSTEEIQSESDEQTPEQNEQETT